MIHPGKLCSVSRALFTKKSLDTEVRTNAGLREQLSLVDRPSWGDRFSEKNPCWKSSLSCFK